MVGVPIVEVKPCTLTEDEHNALPLTEDCGCEETTPEEDAKYLEAARKEHGWVDVPPDAEWTQLQERKAYIRRSNAYLKTLPVQTEEELEQERIEDTALMQMIYDERRKIDDKPLGIGEWPHGDYTPIDVANNRTEGFEYAMSILGIEFRYNVRAVRIEINHPSLGDWRGLDDRLCAEVREVVGKLFTYLKKEEQVPLRWGRDAWNDILNAHLYHREVDPFKDVLEAGPRHDGVERVKGWLQKVFTIEDANGLVEWASIFIFLGAVTRTFEPGTKLDEMPVLIGRGGIGKSTALRYILPPDMPSLFSDSLNLAGTPQERAESMQGRAIVEASELAGVSKADIASLKTFLSRTDDGNVRLAYRHNPELMLRRAIIVGTSDLQSPLPNDRNLRRWAPIYLKDGDPTKLRKYLDENRDQLWAEALSMYRDGKEARLPDKLIDAQVKATAKARSRDVVLEDAVEEFTALKTEPFTMQFLAVSIKLVDSKKGSSVPMGDQKRLSEVLDGMGYSKRQRLDSDGARRWMWHRWEQSNKEISNG